MGTSAVGRTTLRHLVAIMVLSMVAAVLGLRMAPPAAADPLPPGYVSCGYGLVCNGSAPVLGDIAPITVSGLDPWNRIVQSPAAAGWASLEAEATATVAALHGVPNDRRVALWARGEIRAVMLSKLVEAISPPGNRARTPEELQWLDTLRAVIKARRVAMAQSAVDEYNRWNDDPCTYTPPFSYATPPVLPQCALGGGGQLTTIAGVSWDSPPKFEQLETYGAAIQNNHAFNNVDSIAAVNDMTAGLAFLAGAAAGTTLALLAAVAAGTIGALATSIAAMVGSGIAATVGMATASSVGTLAASLGTPVIAAGAVAGAVLMVIIGVVVTAIHSWQIATALQLPGKLAAAVSQAQTQDIDLISLMNDDCGDSVGECGELEITTALLSQTMPDYADQRTAATTAPVRRAFDPEFEVFHESGASRGLVTNLSPNGGPNLSMSDGWFITNDFEHPAQYALESTYVDWNGTPSIVSIHGEKFVTRPAFDPDGVPDVSPPDDCFRFLAGAEKLSACWRGNHAPVIRPTMTQNAVEGSPIEFHANATDPDGGTLTYQWTFQDPAGSFAICVGPYLSADGACPWRTLSVPDVVLTYPNDGLQRAKLVVTDSTGLSATQTFAFQVADIAPVVTLDPAAPDTLTPGGTTTVTGTVTDPGHDGADLTIDWGDGTTTEQDFSNCLGGFTHCVEPESWNSPPLGTRNFTAQHTYATDPTGPNTYTVTATATNAGTGSATTPVTVTEDAPTVQLAPAQQQFSAGDDRSMAEGDTGDPVELNGHTSTLGAFHLEVAWGDATSTLVDYPCTASCSINNTGSPGMIPCNGPCPGRYFHLTHVYADGPANPTIHVTVTDDDGRPVSTTASAQVTNADPSVTFADGHGDTDTAQQGVAYETSLQLSDPGSDTLVGAIDWGDGSDPDTCEVEDCQPGGLVDVSHTYTSTGTYTVTGYVTDDDGAVGNVSRSVHVDSAPNVAPSVTDTSATTDEDTPVTVTPLGTDGDGDSLTYAAGDPAHGSVVVTALGLVYTPAHDYDGPDSFTYTAYDGKATSAPATVSISVTSVDDPPVAVDTTVQTPEDTAVGVDPQATDVDSVVSFQLLTGPAHGTLQGTSAPWTYVPSADYHGPDSFTYAVKSGGQIIGRSALITVTSVNDAPTASDASAQTNEDTAVTVSPHTADVDGDGLTLTVADQPAHGSAAVVAGGIRYTPAADYNGPDSFTYRASDGTLSSSKGTVSVTVNAVNDVPTIGVVTDATAVYSDGITPISVTASDKESGTSGLTFSQTGLPSGLTLTSSAGTGTISGAVSAAPGSFPVTVRVCDSSQGCATRSFTILVGAETAVVRLSSTNPRAVEIGTNGAPAMTLTGRITDSADGSLGDVSRIQPGNVQLTLTPVGGGSAVSCPVTVTRRVVATSSTPGSVDVSCAFPAGTTIDVYDVSLMVSGSFVGSDDSALTVYDPRARGATGAGVVQLGNGNTAEFGFAAAADGKNAKGKLMLVERRSDGTVVHNVKGTALQSLVVGTGSPLPAVITGKAVVDGIGNYSYTLRVSDAGSSGDLFGLTLTAPSGAPTIASLSFAPLVLRPGGAVCVH